MALKIGEVAEAAGVNVQTVRYYERRGLLAEPPRTSSGYRQYDGEAVDRIRFIQRAQELGFRLEEIGDLLELRVEAPERCAEVERHARDKREEIRGKVRDLRRMESVLEELIRACERRARTEVCPILDALEVRNGSSDSPVASLRASGDPRPGDPHSGDSQPGDPQLGGAP